MASNVRLPWVDLALLEYLEGLYPDKMPTGMLDGYELGKKVGRVEVVRMLRRLFDDQVKHALGTETK